MRSQRVLTATAILLGAGSQSAHGQLGFLDNVFEKVTDISAGLTVGKLIGTDAVVTDTGAATLGVGGLGLNGVAFEVSFDIGDFYRHEPDNSCPDYTRITYNMKEMSRTRSFSVADTVRDTTAADTTWVFDVEKNLGKEGRNAQRQLHKSRPSCRDTPALSGQLALGYSQLAGIVGSSVDVRGSVDELPSVSLYMQYETGGWFDPYVGIRTGLAELRSFRAFSGDDLFTGSGSTYQVGVAPGVVFGDPEASWGVFLEAAWVHRKFHNVNWSTDDDGPIPPSLRERLNLSTVTFALGGQVGLGGEDKGGE